MRKVGSARYWRQPRKEVAPCQRRSRVRRARAARATQPKTRPTTTRTPPSRTSVSGSVQEPAIIGALGSDGRCGAPDPGYRHAIPVLWPIESCRRARSSGVGCAKITHMKRTVAVSNSVNVSTARMIAPRYRASRWSQRFPPALETNTLLAPGPGTWTIVSAVAVVAHRQRPPSSGPDKAKCTMSMTPNRASRVPVGGRVTSRGLAGGEAWCGGGNYRGVAMAAPRWVARAPEKAARVLDLTLRAPLPRARAPRSRLA